MFTHYILVLQALLTIKTLISENQKPKYVSANKGLHNTSTTTFALKTSVVSDYQQLTEDTFGVIDYLSQKYNRAAENFAPTG